MYDVMKGMIDAQLPPHVSVITPELRLTIDQLADSTGQSVSRNIISDHEKGLTGSLHGGEHGLYILGKHNVVGKAMKVLTKKLPHDKYSSDDEGSRE